VGEGRSRKRRPVTNHNNNSNNNSLLYNNPLNNHLWVLIVNVVDRGLLLAVAVVSLLV